MMAVWTVIERFGCGVTVVIDTKVECVECAAGGWMDVDDGGREERKKRRGKERRGFCSRCGKSSGCPLATRRVGTKQN
jgi:hypothetical protein